MVPGPLDQCTGGGRYDSHIVSGLRCLGWEVSVHNLPGSFPDADDVAVKSLSAALDSLPDGTRVVIDGLVMGGLPDLVSSHSERLQVLSLVHHPLADETGLSIEEQQRFESSERKALRAATGVVVTSEFTAIRLSNYDVPPERIRTVLPGTEPVEPADGPLPGSPPQLICVASVTPRKGHDVLIAALEKLRDREWTCVCAGSLKRGLSHTESVMEKVEVAELTGRIRFVGEQDASSLQDLYRFSSIFVLASYFEGYGMALTEALAYGLPVVSTTGGAIPFTVPKEASILVEPGDPESLANAVRSLLEDPDLCRSLTEGARRHAAELPNWDQAVCSFAAAVDQLTTRHGNV